MLPQPVVLDLPKSGEVSRRVRRPFHASRHARPAYALPMTVAEPLAAALAPFRNRQEAWLLATFLAEVWGTPSRVTETFPVDRRKVAEIKSLGLTVDRVRGALEKLERIGFVSRAIAVGRTHHRRGDELHRNVVKFRFGAFYGPLLIKAAKTVITARGWHLRRRIERTLAGQSLPLNSPRKPDPTGLVFFSEGQKTGASPESPRSSESPQEAANRQRVVVRPEGFLEPSAHDPNRLERGLAEMLAGIRSRGGTDSDQGRG